VEPKKVELSFLYNKPDFWLDYPDSFAHYERNNSCHNEFLKKIKDSKRVFADYGYDFLASEAERDEHEITASIKEYYGFHEARVVPVSVTLARFLGFSFVEKSFCLRVGLDLLKYVPFLFPLNANLFRAAGVSSELIELFDGFYLVTPLCKTDQSAPLLFDFCGLVHVLLGEKSNRLYFISLAEGSKFPHASFLYNH